jgi:hypothetical protein
MALKRKPLAGNIRRVAPIDNNLRYTITSKADETVQCESFQERKLSLLNTWKNGKEKPLEKDLFRASTEK